MWYDVLTSAVPDGKYKWIHYEECLCSYEDGSIELLLHVFFYCKICEHIREVNIVCNMVGKDFLITLSARNR